jgi:uncharacterized membrane protein
VLCVLLFPGRNTRGSFFAGTALVLMVIAMIITLVVNVPIDRQIQSWTTATLPADWNAIRDRWEYFHGLRTLVSLVALACLFANALSTSEPPTMRDHQAQRGDQRGSTRSTAA